MLEHLKNFNYFSLMNLNCMTKFALIILAIVLHVNALAQPDSGKVKIVDKGLIQLKLVDGRNQQFNRDYMGAMQTYKTILELDPAHAVAHFRIAECHYNLYKYDYAMQYLEKAGNKDPDVSKEYNYMLGLVNHRLEKLDAAIDALQLFLPTVSAAKQKELMVQKHLTDCEFAKVEMAEPKPVSVVNAGTNINTKYRDFGPVISLDGKTLYFSSRRSDSKGGLLAKDNAYYEDIYVSPWDDQKKEWSQAVSLPGKINTESHESISSFNEAGTEMYINVYSGDKWIQDIAISKKAKDSEMWGVPRPMQKKTINTTFFESSASVTGDGKTIYFVAERFGGKGRSDIWRCREVSRGKWSKPENIGVLNTEDDENTVYVTPDEKYLFFSSNGHTGLGGYDIYMSVNENGTWSAPINLGYPINTVHDETHFKPALDFSTGFLTSTRSDSEGLHDIYQVDLKNFDLRAFRR